MSTPCEVVFGDKFYWYKWDGYLDGMGKELEDLVNRANRGHYTPEDVENSLLGMEFVEESSLSCEAYLYIIDYADYLKHPAYKLLFVDPYEYIEAIGAQDDWGDMWDHWFFDQTPEQVRERFCKPKGTKYSFKKAKGKYEAWEKENNHAPSYEETNFYTGKKKKPVKRKSIPASTPYSHAGPTSDNVLKSVSQARKNPTKKAAIVKVPVPKVKKPATKKAPVKKAAKPVKKTAVKKKLLTKKVRA